MADLIKRDSALKGYDTVLSILSNAINAVCEAETNVLQYGSEPEPHWIPCSERLPEVGQDILFSVGDLYVSEGCLRADGDWSQFRWQAIQKKDSVKAWMPLPEPWRGESHD